MKVLIEKEAIEAAIAAMESWSRIDRVKALSDLRAALAEQEEPVAHDVVRLAEMVLSDCGCSTDNETLLLRVADRISRMLSVEQDAEPVAWTRKQMGCDREYCETPFTTDWTPLYTAPQPCQTCESLARSVMMDQMGNA